VVQFNLLYNPLEQPPWLVQPFVLRDWELLKADMHRRSSRKPKGGIEPCIMLSSQL